MAPPLPRVGRFPTPQDRTGPAFVLLALESGHRVAVHQVCEDEGFGVWVQAARAGPSNRDRTFVHSAWQEPRVFITSRLVVDDRALDSWVVLPGQREATP